MSGWLIVVKTWFTFSRFFQITSKWSFKDIPLKNVTVCTWSMSEALFTRPKSIKFTSKRSEGEKDERGER